MSIAENDAQIIDPEMADVPLHAPNESNSKINLKDYQPPSFDVDTVDLDIKLFEDYALVDSTLVMKRQAAGDLVLYGEDIELLAIMLDGEALSSERYEQQSGKLIINNAPDKLTLKLQVRIHPQTNTEHIMKQWCLIFKKPHKRDK